MQKTNNLQDLFLLRARKSHATDAIATILAEKYGADSTFASKCTAISTVLSLITTPLWCLAV